MRDQIVTTVTVKPEDFVFTPFLGSPESDEDGSQRGGLGKAHQLFGEQLPQLINELNTVLAA